MADTDFAGEQKLAPLKKRVLKTGELYTRSEPIERLILALNQMPSAEVLARAAIRDRAAAGWLPGECLVHFLRRCAASGDERGYGRFYELIAARVLARLPRPGRDGGMSVQDERIRDWAVERFLKLLAADRVDDSGRLDFWEARFDLAVKNLKRDALRHVLSPSATAEIPDTGTSDADGEAEPLDDGEAHDPFGVCDPAADAEDDFRLRVIAAIDALPTEQREIVIMRAHGIPIQSDDPLDVTIAGKLGKSDRMIRYLQAKAHGTVRAALREYVR